MPSTTIEVLRTAPIFLGTILTTQRISQYYAFSTFLSKELPDRDRPAFKSWFRIMCPRFLNIVEFITVVQYVLLAVNTGLTPYHNHALLRSKILYGVALALGLLPFACFLKMLKLYRGMMDEKTTPEDSLRMLDTWLKINNWRIWGTEVPALLIIFAAIVNAWG
ncbi:hypothetical protein BP5796_07017 [Coleophoma crateriformis]|uniref:DUF1772-domain-containing protein n=1 Tax=Coleophoma crateriformis TaxID=565419 RepID=A0A3D8RQI0_9HELO|nr:hypothetical protein BP5796_07017 [Coleophoma crateriformis]